MAMTEARLQKLIGDKEREAALVLPTDPLPVLKRAARLREEAEALRELQTRRGREQWQPMETAPKDGTEVLLCWSDGVASPMFAVGYRLGVDRRWQNTHDWLHHDEAWPTHWMPLPSPPVMGETEA